MSKLLHLRTPRKEVSKLLFQHVTTLTVLQQALKLHRTGSTFAGDQAVLYFQRQKLNGLFYLVIRLIGICGEGRIS